MAPHLITGRGFREKLIFRIIEIVSIFHFNYFVLKYLKLSIRAFILVEHLN